jgi:hypothetical protein
MTDWPKHPDGTPMKMGEMTPEQRRIQFREAVGRTKQWFERQEVRVGIAAVIASEGKQN